MQHLPKSYGIAGSQEKNLKVKDSPVIDTYCIEGLMQDGKALQWHFIPWTKFAKAFEVKFLNKENKQEYVWATSWGVSTRLIGAWVMAHSDDQSCITAKDRSIQVVIVPIYKGEESKPVIDAKANEIMKELKAAGILQSMMIMITIDWDGSLQNIN
jgi:prolyl-tRNA synthetase